MLEWHEAPEALGPVEASPFRFSKQGTVHRREAKTVWLLSALTVCGLFVLSGAAAGGTAGAVLGFVAAAALAIIARRLEHSYFVRVVPSLEVHKNGICFCDVARPVYFAELDGLLSGAESMFLAFKKGRDPGKDSAGAPRPWWERAVRRRGYWEVPLGGFADPDGVRRALRETSGLPYQELSAELVDALRSQAAQAIARVPAAAVDSRM
jgi:hypothetical protein